jgi:hypothetical protein
MKFLRIIHALLFGTFAKPTAIAGSSGPHQEDNPNLKYN